MCFGPRDTQRELDLDDNRLSIVATNAELECDLCIVGAGAAGITLGLEFVRSRVRVIILESECEKLRS
jgi:ribulose 1,5-bisphosphate synthetase/thiazole synthase